MNEDCWGYHLLVNCAQCEKASVTDPDVIRDFVKTLVPAIDMTAHGEPIIEHFATHNEKAAGYSLLQLIETSNITAHFSDYNGDCYIDIFSCKPFEQDIALKVIRDFFKPKNLSSTMVPRQAPSD